MTGGAGFIGSNLVSALSVLGHQVTVIDDLSTGSPRSIVELPNALLFEESVVTSEHSEVDWQNMATVFHLAASVGNKRSIEDPWRDSEVNVLGTLAVVRKALASGVPRVVISSSAGIFGELTTLPIAEDHPLEPDSPYGVSKLAAEKHGLVYSKLYDMDVVALRYFNVYGPNQRYDAYGNVIPIFVFQMLKGRPITIFGDGEQTRDFVNVADVVKANIECAAVPGLSGVFNIGSGTRVSVNELARTLHEILGIRWSVEHGPPRPGDVRDSLADIRKARGAFGFDPKVQLYEGLSEYVKWAQTVIDER